MTDMFDNGDNRSYDDYAWLDELGWKRHLPIIARQFNDFLVYRRFCKRATQEEIYELHQIYDKEGLSFALAQMITKLNEKRCYAYIQKERFINEQNNKDPVNVHEFDEQFEEEERWKHLTPEERRRKQNPIPIVHGQCAPIIRISELIAEPIIEKHLSNDGVGYIIHDKLFGMYTAAIVSPMKVKADGTYNVEKVIRRTKKSYLAVPAQKEVAIERQKYNCWLGQGNPVPEKPKPKAPKSEVNIDHVKRAMGMQKNKLNDELNGDIF